METRSPSKSFKDIINEKERKSYLKFIFNSLIGKGEFLFNMDKSFFIVKDLKVEEFTLLSVSFSDIEKFDFSLLEKNKKYLIDFSFLPDQITAEFGGKIVKFLTRFKEMKIAFRVAKPLPHFIFGNLWPRYLQLFSIPKSCEGCLFLFSFSPRGTMETCTGERFGLFRFTAKGRKQIFDYLRLVHGEDELDIPEKTLYSEFKHLKDDGFFSKKGESLFGSKIDYDMMGPPDFSSYWLSKMSWDVDSSIYGFYRKYRGAFRSNYILDNGGGHGRFAFELARILGGNRIILLDIDRKLIKIAKEKADEIKSNIRIILADSRKLPFKKDSFGIILSLGVLHNNIDYEDVLGYLFECYRTLTKSGILFGETWAYWKYGNYLMREFSLCKREKLEEAFTRNNLFILNLNLLSSKLEHHKFLWRFECIKK